LSNEHLCCDTTDAWGFANFSFITQLELQLQTVLHSRSSPPVLPRNSGGETGVVQEWLTQSVLSIVGLLLLFI